MYAELKTENNGNITTTVNGEDCTVVHDNVDPTYAKLELQLGMADVSIGFEEGKVTVSVNGKCHYKVEYPRSF
jgi:hypothetical protein